MDTPSRRGHPRLGYVAVSGAAVLWAVGGTYASALIDDGASFVELTEARAWVTVVVLGLFVWVRGRRASPRAGAPWGLVLLFGIAIAAVNITYYASLALLPVAIAITLEYMAPALVVLFVAVAGRRRPAARTVWAVAVSFAGVALLVEAPVALSRGLRLSGVGLIVGGLSAVAFATYMIAGERLGGRIGTLDLVFRGFLVASGIWVVVQVLRGRPETMLEARFTLPIIFLAVGTTVVPFLLFLWGLDRVQAANAAVVATLEPLSAAVIAFLWLGEVLTPMQILGALMVVTGVTVVQTRHEARTDVLAERAAIE